MIPSPASRILSCCSIALSTASAWNSIIRAAVDCGRCLEALQVYGRMRRAGAPPDNLTFPFVVKACAKLSDVRTGQAAHANAVKSPFWPDVFVQTALVDMYLKCGYMALACDLFDGMPKKDVAAWNVMMSGFVQMGCLRRILDHFFKMRLEEFVPDSITVLLLTQACAVERSLHTVRSVHSLGMQMGVGSDVTVANTWISAYSKCGDLYSAELVFGEIPLSNQTIVSWNSMIAGYAQLGRLNNAIACFLEMCRRGTRPDVSTMPRKTCVSWTAMIDGYALKGDIDGAMDVFHDMQGAGEKPDCATIVAVLSACGRTGAITLGRLINEYAVGNGFDDEIMVCNALLSMYMKCGTSVEAQRLFRNMSKRTLVSWTTMISGYAMNGEFEEALDHFSQMVESGMKPNQITFLAVLQACTHAGFLEKGLEYYGMMTEVHKIFPGLEHYACMVDLLGRKGQVRQALELVQSMPVKPDAVVWGALLGACITHHEIEVGEYASRHLFEIEPQTAVPYVSMANVYASRGRWDGVAKIRTMMREQGTKKSPGQSSVHVDDHLHVFSAQDTIHPEIFRVYQVLHGLYLLMRKADSKV
ncbi:hypothetical protein Taro_009799 [Colocasia esculenta]|uniref:Pentatricopeptide repeat-containing protein n=1 Tax=Colocasia esculenta TaxID=4460 RepID=A0A843U5W9_COLES|nr:hypothetical protein [Colocasia esculenta]